MSVKRKRMLVAVGFCLLFASGLAGAAAYAKHQGWRGPSWLTFLGLAAQARPVDVGLFCNEHGVPEKFCTLCHAELKDKLAMCTEHGVPEEVCTRCHPQNEQKYGLKMICRDHGLPEHLCPQCNPALAAGVAESDWCPEHGVPESLCTLCDPQLGNRVPMCDEHGVPKALCTVCQPELADNFVTCSMHKLPIAFCANDAACIERLVADGKCVDGSCPLPRAVLARATTGGDRPDEAANVSMPRVKLATADIAAKAGIEVATADYRTSAPSITAASEVGYDETRLAHVRPRVAGVVREVQAEVGDVVQEGDVLAIIDSAELGQAKAAYLAAAPMLQLWRKNVDRLSGLDDRQIVAGKKLLEAEAELARAEAAVIKARQQLRNLGLPTYEIAALNEEPEEKRNLLEIRAPQDGTVIARHAVAGEAVEATMNLFGVADMSAVWVHMDVYEKDLARIAVGQTVTFVVPGLAPREFEGTVAWIASEVDEHARTIRVRANVPNEQGLLRANMFGEARIEVGAAEPSLVVPSAAVQWSGSSYVVFVKKQEDLYEPRRVLRGAESADGVKLAWADLRPGDSVVTTGSFLLKTEIQKGAIGAGCCGE